MRTYIWETKMQKMTRLDKEFEALAQGGMSHANFRVLWETKLQDMEEANMDMPTADTLYRKYLAKIAPDLRSRVLSKEWKLDGEDQPVRAVKTFTDVARAVSLLLEERADIRATGYDQYDSFMSIDGGTGGLGGGKGNPSTKGNSVTCNYCQMANNHHSTVCPQRAADTRV